MHLAKLEAKQEWENTENQFHSLESKLRDISADASGASKEIMASAKQLMEEIESAYHRIRRHL